MHFLQNSLVVNTRSIKKYITLIINLVRVFFWILIFLYYICSMVYSEEQVKRIVWFACGMQKAEDFQIVMNIVLRDDFSIEEKEVKDISAYLWDTDTNVSSDISLEDINQFLEEDVEEG